MDKHGFFAYVYNEDKLPGFKSNLRFVLTKFMYFSNHLHKTKKNELTMSRQFESFDMKKSQYLVKQIPRYFMKDTN